MNKYEGKEKELNIYNLYWLSRSYYKIKKYNESLKIYKLYKNLNPEEDTLKNAIIWAFYYIMKTKKDRESLLKFANFLMNNCPKENFLLYRNTVDFVIKFLENEKGINNKEKNYEWLIKVNPNLLSKEPYIIQNDGKPRELSSKYEKYYVLKSKYELNLGLYEECIKTCKFALKNIEKFHTDNDVWFKFKISKALKEIGNLKESKELLEELGKMNKHFAIKSELGDVLIKLGDMKNGKIKYYEGLVSKVGTLESKVNLIEKVGDILIDHKDFQKAKLNYLLAKKIREENNWKVAPNLTKKIDNLKDITLNIKENEIINTCMNTWCKDYFENLEKADGKVTFILKNNKGGFIQSKNDSIYFSANELKNCKIQDSFNKKVNFNIIEGYNKHKKEVQKEAINIKISSNSQ